MIAGGDNRQYPNSTAINCNHTTPGCEKIGECTISNSPLRSGSVGGVLGDQVIICGGHDGSDLDVECTAPYDHCPDSCYKLGQSHPFTYMAKERAYASAVVLNDVLWISGGQGRFPKIEASSEFLGVQDGDDKPGPDLPYEVSNHCVIKLSNSLILMTGGSLHWISDPITITYYHTFTSGNGNDGTWTPGPDLIEARRDHACAAFGSGIPIVAGGRGLFDLFIKSVELLVGGEWITSNALDTARSGARLVSLGNDVLLTGGFESDDGLSITSYCDSIYQMYCNQDAVCDHWTYVGSFSYGRGHHVAMMAPPSAVDCFFKDV